MRRSYTSKTVKFTVSLHVFITICSLEWYCHCSNETVQYKSFINFVLANVYYMLSTVRLSSVCRLSVVCNVGASYSGHWNFRQYFSAIWYPGHPL